MIDAEELQALLLGSRNRGWGLAISARPLSSWTEPTALALIALQGTQVPNKTRALTAAWLASQQSPDGGWPPCAAVPTSTWVTSLVLLALAQEREHSAGCPKGTLWLSAHVYPELNAFQGFLQHSLGLIALIRRQAVRPGFPEQQVGSFPRRLLAWRCPVGLAGSRTRVLNKRSGVHKLTSCPAVARTEAGITVDLRNGVELPPLPMPKQLALAPSRLGQSFDFAQPRAGTPTL